MVLALFSTPLSARVSVAVTLNASLTLTVAIGLMVTVGVSATICRFFATGVAVKLAGLAESVYAAVMVWLPPTRARFVVQDAWYPDAAV
jgi:hypothetical protein